MNNVQIAKILRNIAASYAIKDERKFRFQIIAYQRAADAIENSTTQVKDLMQEGKLQILPGVGPSICKHLEELLTTGKVKHFEWVTHGIPESVFPLLDVPSFGPKKAYRLVQELSLKNPQTILEDIQKLAETGKIEHLEGFGEKSQEDIIKAISEYKRGMGKTQRMVLPYASELAEKIVAFMKQCTYVEKIYPLGSLRRLKSTIGDIDMAVATDNPKEVITHFVSYPHVERIVNKGQVSSTMLTSGGKQIDLMCMPKDSFGSLLQHFTGSKNHNVHLREYALKKGLSLSEYGIKKVHDKKNRIKKLNTEEKFYEALGLDWIPPEIREDTGEIERAETHTLPKLIELPDIKGDLHIHSSFPIEPSHDMGKDPMEDMIEKAMKLGYEYMAFTEHNPSVSKHTKEQIYILLQKKKEKVEKLNRKYTSFFAVNSLELDILTDGALAIDNKALDLLDMVLVSIHSSFGMDKKHMTERILKGLSHPKAKVLTHPTGRLLNTRPGYEIDLDKILEFCKKHDKALEINAWPARLDLSDIMVREAVDKGVKLVISTDSHALWQMDNIRYGVAVARRGWAERKNIVNTLPIKEFIQWVKHE